MTIQIGGENRRKNSKDVGTGTKSPRSYTRGKKILQVRFQLFSLFKRIKKFFIDREITDVTFFHPFGSFKVRKKKMKDGDTQ